MLDYSTGLPFYESGPEKKNPAIIKQKRLPVKRTQRHSMAYVHRVGYYSLVSSYTGGNTVSRLSGSSINRKKRQREKIEQTRFVTGKKGDIKPAILPGGSIVNTDLLTQAEENRFLSLELIPDTDGGNVQPLHVFSPRTRGNIKQRATAFYRSITSRKIFCTLTFIGDVTDASAVGILNKFLTVIRKDYPKLKYLWVAERQKETTDRIHFHIILNTFMPIKRINALWVLQQYNSGITFRDYTLTDIQERIERGTMQEILNPVDVKLIKNIGVLSSYLTKYITKGNNKDGFGCQVWHCSREVSRLFIRTLASIEAVELIKGIENCKVNKKTGEFYGMPQPVREKTGTSFFYTIWYINQPGRFLCYLREMEQINKWVLDGSASVDDVISYLGSAVTDDYYRKHYLN